MVTRGKCTFAKKAESLQGTGSKLMMVVSDGEGMESFGAVGKTASKIYLPGIMVNKKSGEVLNELLVASAAEGKPLMVEILPARGGFAERWRELTHVVWPDDKGRAWAMYENMKKENEGSEERLEVLDTAWRAYARKGFDGDIHGEEGTVELEAGRWKEEL